MVPPYVVFDGQRMNYGKRIGISFNGGAFRPDAGRVFLEVGKHVSEDQYRRLKAGSLATVKGTVRIKFYERSVDIIIENTRMD